MRSFILICVLIFTSGPLAQARSVPIPLNPAFCSWALAGRPDFVKKYERIEPLVFKDFKTNGIEWSKAKGDIASQVDFSKSPLTHGNYVYLVTFDGEVIFSPRVIAKNWEEVFATNPPQMVVGHVALLKKAVNLFGKNVKILAAGEFYVGPDGRVVWVDNKSGKLKPGPEGVIPAAEAIRGNGFPARNSIYALPIEVKSDGSVRLMDHGFSNVMAFWELAFRDPEGTVKKLGQFEKINEDLPEGTRLQIVINSGEDLPFSSLTLEGLKAGAEAFTKLKKIEEKLLSKIEKYDAIDHFSVIEMTATGAVRAPGKARLQFIRGNYTFILPETSARVLKKDMTAFDVYSMSGKLVEKYHGSAYLAAKVAIQVSLGEPPPSFYPALLKANGE